MAVSMKKTGDEHWVYTFSAYSGKVRNLVSFFSNLLGTIPLTKDNNHLVITTEKDRVTCRWPDMKLCSYTYILVYTVDILGCVLGWVVTREVCHLFFVFVSVVSVVGVFEGKAELVKKVFLTLVCSFWEELRAFCFLFLKIYFPCHWVKPYTGLYTQGKSNKPTKVYVICHYYTIINIGYKNVDITIISFHIHNEFHIRELQINIWITTRQKLYEITKLNITH